MVSLLAGGPFSVNDLIACSLDTKD